MPVQRCPGCGTSLKFDSSRAGKRVKCPKCQMVVLLSATAALAQPTHNIVSPRQLPTREEGRSEAERIGYRHPAGFDVRKARRSRHALTWTIAASILAAGCVLAFLLTRDNWEKDNKTRVIEMCHEAKSLIEGEKLEEGVKRYNELTTFIGTRSLQDRDLLALTAEIRTVAESTKRQLAEAKNMESLRSMVLHATALAQSGELEQSLRQLDGVLVFIEAHKTGNPEFAAIHKSVALLKTEVQQRLNEQRLKVTEATRLAELRRVEAENEAKGLIKVDGEWITKEKAELIKLRAEMEALKNRAGKVVVTVTWKYNDYVGHKPDTDAVVILLPEALTTKPEGEFLFPPFVKIALERCKREMEAKGAYLEIAGGDGKATFNQVKAGKYVLVIVSNNTYADPKFEEARKQSLERDAYEYRSSSWGDF